MVPVARLSFSLIIRSTLRARLVEALLYALQFPEYNPVGLRQSSGAVEELLDVFFDISNIFGDLFYVLFDLI
jgi:hypothetical protein